MFTALFQLVYGNITEGIALLLIMIPLFGAYLLLTRNGSKYPTNLCVVGAILSGIGVDVMWSLFNFNDTPFFGSGNMDHLPKKIFFEFMAAGVIFLSGLMITNIIKVKKYRKVKILLYVLYVLTTSAIIINLVSVRPIKFTIIFPFMSLFATNIILICVECLLIITIGAMAVAARGVKSKVNTATALALAIMTILAGAIGIYECVRDEKIAEEEIEVEVEQVETIDIY